MHLRSETGEIEVFLLPEDQGECDAAAAAAAVTKVEQGDIKSEPGTSAQYGGALLSEADDYGPMGGGKFQLQTEDQHPSTSGNLEMLPQLLHELPCCLHLLADFACHSMR